MASPKVAVSACLLILTFASSCIRRPPHRELRSIPFHGRLFAFESGDWQLYEITASPSGGARYNVLSRNVLSAALSPSGKYLLYYFDPPSDPKVKDNYLVLRDVASGEEKRIITNIQLNMLTWATDSRTFSYESEHTLFVADLAGNSHAVYQTPHGKYNAISTSGSSLYAKEMYAPFGRAKWIAPDRFVFERFEGDLPFYGDVAWNELFIEPNKTTIVQTGRPVRLVNLEKKWIVRGVCPDQSLLLLGEDFRQGQLYLTTVNDLEHGNVRPLPADVNTVGPVLGNDVTRYDFNGTPFQYVQFMRPSCRLIYLKDEREKANSTQISYIDPATLQRSQGPKLEMHHISNIIFDPANKLAVVINEEQPINWLSLVDMESGEVWHLNTNGINTTNLVFNWRLLGWID